MSHSLILKYEYNQKAHERWSQANKTELQNCRSTPIARLRREPGATEVTVLTTMTAVVTDGLMSISHP